MAQSFNAYDEDLATLIQQQQSLSADLRQMRMRKSDMDKELELSKRDGVTTTHLRRAIRQLQMDIVVCEMELRHTLVRRNQRSQLVIQQMMSTAGVTDVYSLLQPQLQQTTSSTAATHARTGSIAAIQTQSK